jgi:phage terminase large subunit-like protein
MKDYAAIATAYARDVVGGSVPACKWVRLACQRHLRNLDQAAAGWQYVWNPELVDRAGKTYRPADRICRFAELMPHIKGDWAARGERIRLEPWQVFCLASIFGWIDVETLKRRFRKADLFIPRKNAKSTIAAIIGNYMLALDNEFGAEVYSGATSKDQALEVFRPASLMAKAAGEFRARYGVVVNASNMAVVETNSKFEPLIGDPGDGASPSCSITDEYHEHKTSSQYDTMVTGMGARSQPLALVITTAGNNIGGPCYVHQVELERILEGVIVNEQRFGIAFGIDKDDDWTDPKVLAKANPNFGVSVGKEFLLEAQATAITDPRKQAVFKTKHLNVWVNAASPWINIQTFQRCGDRTLRREDYAGFPCVPGLDLASKNDIASHIDLFRQRIDGLWHYYLFSRNYLPKAAIDKPENQHYQDWVERGDLIATPGNMIDLHQIREGVEAGADVCTYDEIAIDAWGSREIAPQLQANGHTVVDIPMTTRNLSEPMKEIAALVDAGRFHHDGNLATIWMFSNVEVFEDRNENIFPRKASAEKKIDAAVATILAMSRLMVGDKDDGYASQAFIDLNAMMAPAA